MKSAENNCLRPIRVHKLLQTQTTRCWVESLKKGKNFLSYFLTEFNFCVSVKYKKSFHPPGFYYLFRQYRAYFFFSLSHVSSK